MKDQNWNQAQLAAAVDRDRTTILAYQRAGLPYGAGDAGGDHKFIPAVAISWIAGFEQNKKLHDEREDPLFLILLGRLRAWSEERENLAHFFPLVETLGYSLADYYLTVGYIESRYYVSSKHDVPAVYRPISQIRI